MLQIGPKEVEENRGELKKKRYEICFTGASPSRRKAGNERLRESINPRRY
jgi:hypothetical protein